MSRSGCGEKEPLAPPEEQGGILLRTKFFIPPIRSNQIARPRLVDLINAGLDRTLILVSAPAGYGKTTLVSSWLQETKIPSAWLSLDAAIMTRSVSCNTCLPPSTDRSQASRTTCSACSRESNQLNLKM